MTEAFNPVVVIPAHLASTRLSGKPLAEIADTPMIVHVWRRACAAKVGPVYVACADKPIADTIRRAEGEAVMTRPDHASGSDRVFEALEEVDAEGRFDAVVNVQGDMPTLDPALIRTALAALAGDGVDVATLAAPIHDRAARENPNVVKAVVAVAEGGGGGRALYFTRAAAPWGDGPVYHHIGLYAYRRAALEAFVKLPPSPLEKRERLEQLRALEAGMRIEVAFVDSPPEDVNTSADLERVRALMAGLEGAPPRP
ncbi:MAG: 3-deoxy-manno-octulosonate cytidylyltransferase [Alphaproteobacteria bacterium]